MRTGAGLAALALALGACGAPNGGGSGSGSGSGPDGPVAGTPGTGSGGGGEVVSPRPGMADVDPVEWDKVRLAEDGRTLWLRWWGGVAPCHVLDRIEVRLGHRVVIVTLLEGRVPGKEDVACPEMAQLKEAKTTLAQPLDGRRVVDGAKLGAALRNPDKCAAIKKCPLGLHPNSSSSVERPNQLHE